MHASTSPAWWLLPLLILTGCWTFESVKAECTSAGRCLADDGGSGGVDGGASDAGPCDYLLTPQPGDLCFHRFATMAPLLGVVGERDASVDVITVTGLAGECFESGVLAPTGNVIAVPYDTQNPLVIPAGVSHALTAVGCTSGTAEFAGGVVSRNGKVYLIPFASRTDLAIADPLTGALTGAGRVGPGDQSWWAGVVARDGRIVLSPSKSPTMGIFDPSDAGFESWPCADPSTTGRFSGAVVTSNDEVWLVPNSAEDWYRVDFENRTTTRVGLAGSSTKRGWYGATLGGDGWLYPPPDRGGELWRIDPRTGLSESYGNLPMTDSWAAGALGHDGRIYLCPDRASTILVIEPAGNAGSVTWYQLPVPSTALAGSGTSFGAAVTSSDGRTYCIPASGQALVAITPQSSRRLPLDVLLSPHFDKY